MPAVTQELFRIRTVASCGARSRWRATAPSYFLEGVVGGGVVEGNNVDLVMVKKALCIVRLTTRVINGHPELFTENELLAGRAHYKPAVCGCLR